MLCLRCKTTMRPFREFVRWWTCPACFRVYWYDGPSLLSEKDPQRKRTMSDRLEGVTATQFAWVKDL